MNNAQNTNDRLFWTTTHVEKGMHCGYYTCGEYKFEGFKTHGTYYTLDLPVELRMLKGLNKELWIGFTGCFDTTKEARTEIRKVVASQRAWDEQLSDWEYIRHCESKS